MLETCRGSWFPINWMKRASRWFHYTVILICDILVCASAVVWTECWRSHRHIFCSTSCAVSCHIPLAVFGITRELSCLQLSTRSPLFIELVRNQSIPVPTKSLTRKLSIWTDHLIFLTCLIPQWHRHIVLTATKSVKRQMPSYYKFCLRLQDFELPAWCSWGFHSSGMLRALG
jgi:hypothetical protein